MTPIVKICGLTNVEDAVLSFENGADMLGLIFSDSPRQVLMASAEAICSRLSGRITLVGVFANRNDPKIFDVCKSLNLDMLQLYFSVGDRLSDAYPLPVLRSYFIKAKTDLMALDVSGALLDLKYVPELLNDIPAELDRPGIRQAILAGGLNNQNIDAVIERFQPRGVDVARGVESSPGKKDKSRLEMFIRKVKAWSYPTA